MSVSKVESHILDGLSYYTGEIFLSTQKAIPYSVNKALDTDFREEAYKKSNSWLRPWLPSPSLYNFRSVFIFLVVSCAYKVCMFCLLLININISMLFRWLSSIWNSVLLKLTIIIMRLFRYFLRKTPMHFLPCATFINWNRSNQSSGVQIPWDICTRF